MLARLRSMGSEADRQGMARFGIDPEHALGIRVTALRKLAREIGRDHKLAAALWKSGVHEARMLATMVEEPDEVTRAQAERWAKDFSSWDIVDGACGNLLDKTPFKWDLAREWARRDEEFVKRAGFALVAWSAVHDKKATDAPFVAFLPEIERGASDPRNFVKKAVSWALRQVGKRNARLRKEALAVARRLAASEDAAARWVGKDAVRELASQE